MGQTMLVGEREWELGLLLPEGGSICFSFVKPWVSPTSLCQLSPSTAALQPLAWIREVPIVHCILLGRQ